jgi:16S rRNA (uracil1498-N3)-methyltransferase
VRDRRFLVKPSELTGEVAIISGQEHRHLARVLRLEPGDAVIVFDGRGRAFHARIQAVERDRTIATLLDPEPPAAGPALRLVLLQAILHTGRMEGIVEKATELGASTIVPVVSARSVVRPGRKGWGRRDRLERVAVAAAKQSGRLVVPGIAEPVAFEDAIAREPSSAPRAMRLIFHGGSPPVAGILAGGGTSDEAWLLIGPEGGWSDEEIAAAAAAGWRAAGLGPATLRAETAAVVACGLVMALAGGSVEP